MTRVLGSMVGMLLLGLAASAAHAQALEQPTAVASDPALAAQTERMSQWLAELSRQSASSHAKGGWTLLLLGAASVAGGVLIALEDDYANDVPRGVLSALFIGFGGILMTGGIYDLTGPPTTHELRYTRWRALRSVDATTLARFESELAAEAAVARERRLSSGIESIGLAVGGAVMLAVTPFSRMHDDAAAMAYILGAVNLGMGTLNAILSLSGESPNETAYRSYQEGKPPEQAANRLWVSPVLARGGAGVQIVGTL